MIVILLSYYFIIDRSNRSNNYLGKKQNGVRNGFQIIGKNDLYVVGISKGVQRHFNAKKTCEDNGTLVLVDI